MTQRRNALTAGAVTAVALFAGIALAAGPAWGAECKLKVQEADINDNGMVSPYEASQVRKRSFMDLDANANAMVSLAEWNTCIRPRNDPNNRFFREMDVNGDDSLSLTEYMAPLGRSMARETVVEALPEPMGSPPDMQTYAVGTVYVWDPLASMDYDKDGYIRRDEAGDSYYNSFIYLDKNRDARISLEEWQGEPKFKAGRTTTFRALDSNGDRELTQAEFLQALEADFANRQYIVVQ